MVFLYRYIQVYIIFNIGILYPGFHHGSTMDAMDLGKVPWGFTMVKSHGKFKPFLDFTVHHVRRVSLSQALKRLWGQQKKASRVDGS